MDWRFLFFYGIEMGKGKRQSEFSAIEQKESQHGVPVMLLSLECSMSTHWS